jgi:hypothetical protein
LAEFALGTPGNPDTLIMAPVAGSGDPYEAKLTSLFVSDDESTASVVLSESFPSDG